MVMIIFVISLCGSKRVLDSNAVNLGWGGGDTFIIRINCKNDPICLMMSFIFSLFYLQVLGIPDLEFWSFKYFKNGIFYVPN